MLIGWEVCGSNMMLLFAHFLFHLRYRLFFRLTCCLFVCCFPIFCVDACTSIQLGVLTSCNI